MNKSNNKDILTKKGVVAALALLCCVLWGSAIPFIKTALRIMNVESSNVPAQILFAGMRFTIAGFMVIVFACIREKRVILLNGQTLKYAPILCLVQTVGQYFFFYVGVANSMGVSGGILTGIGNFILIIFSCLLFRMEKMTTKKAIGCMLGFAAILVINLFGNAAFGGIHFMGEGFLLISQICYAMSSILIRIFSRKASPVLLSGYQFFLGGLIMCVIGVSLGATLPGMNVAVVCILLYLAMVSAVAYTVWSILLAHNPVSSVAIWGFINPIASVTLSAIILHEYQQAFNLGSLIALACVSAGIFIVNTGDGV